MSDDQLEKNVARLLEGTVPHDRGPARPDEAFRARLEARLLAETAPARPAPRTAVRGRFRRVASYAGLALASAAVIVIGLGQPASVRVDASRPQTLTVPAGTRSWIEIGGPGRPPLLRAELRGPAEATWQPTPPVLRVEHGWIRTEAASPVAVQAAGVEVALQPGAELELELSRGGTNMAPKWLLPASTAIASGVLVGLVVHRGSAAVRGADGTKAAPHGQLVVMEGARPDDRLVDSQRHVAMLERKVTGLRQENDRLAAQLADKKGVTVKSVMARIGELKEGGAIAALASPGKLTDVETDLKGLGAAGVQAMVDLLKSKDDKDRFLAARILEDLDSPAAIPALRDVALGDSDALAAKMASHALALMESPGTTDALRDIVKKKPSWEAEVNALWGLCKQGDPDAIAQAMVFLKDKEGRSEDQRAALGINLLLLKGEDLLPLVDEVVSQWKALPQTVAFAAEYYKGLGEAGRSRLEALANDPALTEDQRGGVKKLLGR